MSAPIVLKLVLLCILHFQDEEPEVGRPRRQCQYMGHLAIPLAGITSFPSFGLHMPPPPAPALPRDWHGKQEAGSVDNTGRVLQWPDARPGRQDVVGWSCLEAVEKVEAVSYVTWQESLSGIAGSKELLHTLLLLPLLILVKTTAIVQRIEW